MGRSTMWTEILKRAVVLKDIPVHEVPALVKSFGIGRVMMTGARGVDPPHQPALEEHLISTLSVPLWILSRGMPLSLAQPELPRRILLPVFAHTHLELGLRFAWQLAKQHHAALSILHVFEDSSETRASEERRRLTVESWLPWSTLKVSPDARPIEVAVRQGDPATEILKFNASKPHDLMILRCSADLRFRTSSHSKIAKQVCAQAPCPVLILGHSFDELEYGASARETSPPPRPLNKRLVLGAVGA